MRHHLLAPQPRRAALACLIHVLVSTSLAGADDAQPAADPAARQIHVVPAECRAYLDVPDDARDDWLEWEQGLSFAACLQDARVASVHDPARVEAMVEELSRGLHLPMLIYAETLSLGPAQLQLRAAFHIGMAQLALSTRARASIALPPELAAGPAAAERRRALQAKLEPLLSRARRAAWVSFSAIDEAAVGNPALASDPVAHHMIRAARAMLRELRDVGELRLLRGR